MSIFAKIQTCACKSRLAIPIGLFALGALSARSMAPANLWPVLFIGLGGLYFFVSKAPTPFKAGLYAMIFALGYFGFSLSWIGNALLIKDNPYWWAWPLAVSGLPLLLSLFPASLCMLHKYISLRLIKSAAPFLNYVSFCICLAISDYARGHIFTGFPWNLYGYTWADILPIAQLASISDIYLLNIVTIFWAVFPAFIITSPYKWFAKTIITTLVILSFAVIYIFGQVRIDNYDEKYIPDTQVIVVQPNIKQSEKWKPENRAKNFLQLVEMSNYNDGYKAKNTIIIWPETAISQDVLNTKWAMDRIRSLLANYPDTATLVTGALLHNSETNTYNNSIITLNSKAEITNQYDKKHLVPFGEYMPLSNIFDIAPIVGFTGFQKGEKANIQRLPSGARYAAVICYEIIFPHFTRFFNIKKPDFIINVTNDAWYGNSAGPYQHIVQVKFRAIESGIPVIRSANTGVSIAYSPIGKAVSSIKLGEKNIFIGKIPLSIALLE